MKSKEELKADLDKTIDAFEGEILALIDSGEKLIDLEAYFRMKTGVVFNKAFRRECEGLKRKKEGKKTCGEIRKRKRL